MPVIQTSQIYVNGNTVTSTNLNAIAGGSSFVAGAVTGTTLAVVGGALKVNTITATEMGTGAVTTTALLDGNVTPAKLSVGYPVWTDSTAGSASLAIGSIRTANSGSSTITFDSSYPLTDGHDAKITRASGPNGDLTISNSGTGSIKFNAIPLGTSAGVAPLYGARAWVQFSGTTAGTFAGGTSTVVRVAASTTATVTTTNDHGLIVGNTVNALTGVLPHVYAVTGVTSSKIFTFTTVETTALNTGITFSTQSIQSSGNVSSVVFMSNGRFAVNFSIPMPSEFYSVSGESFTSALPTTFSASFRNVGKVDIYFKQGAVAGALVDSNPTSASVIVFA